MAPRTSLTLLLSPAFLLLLSGHCATVTSLSFFYNFSNPKTFSHGGDLHFEGHAYMGDGSIILAKNRDVRDDVSSKAGRVSSKHPVYLWSNNKKTSEVVTGFSTSFSFVIIGGSNSSNDTGGTLSFFLGPFSPQMPLEKEAGLFDSATVAGGRQLGVTAVMDRSSHGDFGWDTTNLSSENYKVVVHVLADGVLKILQLDYSDVAKDLVIALRDFSNGSTTATIKISVDLQRFLPQEVAVGFFASTVGSGATVPQVLWWSFCTHTATVQGNLPNPTLARYLLDSPDNSSAPPLEGHHGSGGKSNRKVVLGSIVGVVLFAVTALVVACLCCIKKIMIARRMALAPVLEAMELPEIDDMDLEVPFADGGPEGEMYSYEEVLNATDNFSEERLLGGGRSCSFFYRGDNFANSNKPVAVKILEIRSYFWEYDRCQARIIALTKCRHRNVVRLMGWCDQGSRSCLVYEFVENGNLVEHLYSPGRFLPWKLRYKIVLGMASALEYLHDNDIHHGNIKLSNVMLDESFHAKLGDFSLSFGWRSKYDDVQSFGNVLLEIACGQQPLIFSWQDLDPDKFVLLGYQLWDMYKKGTILEAADERLNGDFDNGEMERVLLVGLMCCYTTRPPIKLSSIREAARLLRFDPSEPLLPWTVQEPITDVDEACGSADHTLPKPPSP